MSNTKKIDFSKIKRILLINMGGIGDIILFTPVLKILRKTLPNSCIALMIAEPGVEDVVKESEFIDEVILYDRTKRQSVAKKLQFIKFMRKKAFDLAIVSAGTNSFNGSLLTYLMGIPNRVGENINHLGLWYTTKVDYQNRLYELDSNLNLVKAIGIEPLDDRPFIHISKEAEEFAEQFLSENKLLQNNLIICLHIGPTSPGKNFRRWSDRKFLELANKLIDSYQAKLILIGGPDEIDLVNKISSLMKIKPAVSAGKTSIGQTAALIKKSRLFIGSDSGPMHIAGAVGTPIVAIFGPTDAKNHHPYGHEFIIVRKDLVCSPCYHRGKIKCKHLDCFKLITVEEVFVAVNKQLSQIKMQ